MHKPPVLEATAAWVVPVRGANDQREGWAEWEYHITVDVEALLRETAYAAATARRRKVSRANGAVVVKAVRVTHRKPEGHDECWTPVPDGKK